MHEASLMVIFLLHFLLFIASERLVRNWQWQTTFQFVSVTPRPLTKSCPRICSVASSAGCSRSPKSGGNSSASVATETFLVVHEISGCNPVKTHHGNFTHHSLSSLQEVQTRGSIFFLSSFDKLWIFNSESTFNKLKLNLSSLRRMLVTFPSRCIREPWRRACRSTVF